MSHWLSNSVANPSQCGSWLSAHDPGHSWVFLWGRIPENVSPSKELRPAIPAHERLRQMSCHELDSCLKKREEGKQEGGRERRSIGRKEPLTEMSWETEVGCHLRGALLCTRWRPFLSLVFPSSSGLLEHFHPAASYSGATSSPVVFIVCVWL